LIWVTGSDDVSEGAFTLIVDNDDG